MRWKLEFLTLIWCAATFARLMRCVLSGFGLDGIMTSVLSEHGEKSFYICDSFQELMWILKGPSWLFSFIFFLCMLHVETVRYQLDYSQSWQSFSHTPRTK